jgi:hypothetical protein
MLPDQRYISRIYNDENERIESNRFRRQSAHGHQAVESSSSEMEKGCAKLNDNSRWVAFAA